MLSWGVNGAGAVVMVAVFAQTGGLTGGEIAVAGGTAVSASGCWRRCSVTPPCARWPTQAREDLEARADALLRYEQERFDDRVAAAAPAPRRAEELRAAVAASWPRPARAAA